MAAAVESAFTELYAAHAERLHTYCLRLTGSADDAADALQDTFTAVLARLDSDAEPIEHPKAYLYAAARNACLLRIAERGRTEVVAEVPEAEPPTGPAGGEQAVLTDELRREVRAAHDKLPDRQREVLFLREVEGLSYAAIGTVMELTPNGAAQLAWRARAGLRTDLQHKALLAVAVYDRDCDRARTLLGLREDDGIDPADDAWLDQHLADCERCRASRGLLLEAGLTYRAVLPIAVLPFTAEKAWASAREAQAAASGGGGQGGGGPPRSGRGAMAGAAAGAIIAGMLLLTASAQTPVPAPPAAVQIAALAPPAPERTHDAAQAGADAPAGEDEDEDENGAEQSSRAGASARGSTDPSPDDEPADADNRASGGGDDDDATTPPTSPADDTARVPRPTPPLLTPVTGRDPVAPEPVSTVAPSQTPPTPLAAPPPQATAPTPASPGPGIPEPPGEPAPVDPPPCDSSGGNNGSSGPGGACEPCRPGQERRPDDDEGPPLLGTALRITLCVEVGAELDLGGAATPPRAPRRGAGAASRGR